jgi:hypothetical protein
MCAASYSDYEYRVAMALSSHPGLPCLDELNFFSLVQGKQSDPSFSLWDLPTVGSSEVEEVEDYDEHTARVDVFQVALNPVREQQHLSRPFRFFPTVRVVSKSLVGFMPSADLVMVDAYPLTREVVLDAVREFLLSKQYEHNEFLWGPDLTSIREENPQG